MSSVLENILNFYSLNICFHNHYLQLVLSLSLQILPFVFPLYLVSFIFQLSSLEGPTRSQHIPLFSREQPSSSQS